MQEDTPKQYFGDFYRNLQAEMKTPEGLQKLIDALKDKIKAQEIVPPGATLVDPRMLEAMSPGLRDAVGQILSRRDARIAPIEGNTYTESIPIGPQFGFGEYPQRDFGSSWGRLYTQRPQRREL